MKGIDQSCSLFFIIFHHCSCCCHHISFLLILKWIYVMLKKVPNWSKKLMLWHFLSLNFENWLVRFHMFAVHYLTDVYNFGPKPAQSEWISGSLGWSRLDPKFWSNWFWRRDPEAPSKRFENCQPSLPLFLGRFGIDLQKNGPRPSGHVSQKRPELSAAGYSSSLLCSMGLGRLTNCIRRRCANMYPPKRPRTNMGGNDIT